MTCRILNIAVGCCLLFLVGACRKNGRVVPIVYKQDFLLDTAVSVKTFFIEGDLVEPKGIERMGDRIFVFGGYREMGIYTYPEMNFIRKMTYPFADHISVGDSCLYFLSGRNIDTYVLQDDSLCKTSSVVIAYPNRVINPKRELSTGVFLYPDYPQFPGMYEFHILDTIHRKRLSKGSYPEDNSKRFKNLEHFKELYSHSVCVKPDKSAFVVIYGALRRIRIYNPAGDLQHDVFLEGSLGNYKLIPARLKELYVHFVDAFVTDKYIYLINPGRLLMSPDVFESNILVLDWQGNLVAKYRLGVYVNDIFVDEERNVMYGSCWKEGEGIVFFTMNMLHDNF